MEGFGHHPCPHPTPPLAGDKPQRYISLGTLGCRCSGDGGWRRRPEPEFIPDRSPGHAFVPIADAGRRRHTQGLKIGLRWLVEVSWVSLVPPLDSGFRRNDDWGAGLTSPGAGLTSAGAVAFRHF